MPGRSRTASRYESVATSRSPPPSAVNITPVRIGRDSSLDAAGTTWRSPSANCPVSSVTLSPPGSASCGYSSTGIRCSENSERPPTMRPSVPSVDSSTAPGSSSRMISRARRAGRTALPSSSPATLTVAEIVRSRSLPVISSRSPSSCSRSPDSTGSDPPRPAARPAVVRASTSTSCSHLNFNARAFLLQMSHYRAVAVVGPVNWGQGGEIGVAARFSCPPRVPRRPHDMRVVPPMSGDDARMSTGRHPVLHGLSTGPSTAHAVGSRPRSQPAFSVWISDCTSS